MRITTAGSSCGSARFRAASRRGSRAKGIAVEIEDPVAYVKAFGEKIPNARPSMLLDHMAGRRSEIDVINGAVPRVGREVGIETPVNATVSNLVRARESAFA